MNIDKQEIKALAGRVKTDRRFCADEYHHALAEGVQALLAEIEGLHAQHGRDSAELRRLCSARDEVRRERDRLKAENEALKSPQTGYAGAFYDFCRLVGVANARPESPAAVFKGQVVPAVEALRKDAERYRWLKSNTTVMFRKTPSYVNTHGVLMHTCYPPEQELDAAIDAAMAKEASRG